MYTQTTVFHSASLRQSRSRSSRKSKSLESRRSSRLMSHLEVKTRNTTVRLQQHSRATCTSSLCSYFHMRDIHSCRSDESFKSIANLYSFFKDAPSSVAAPFNLFSGEEAPLWKWYQKPDNVWRLHRFAAAMKGQDGLPSAPFTELLDWKSIPRDSVVVDVGGSVGKVTYELFKAFPHLKYVIQDVPLVVDDAKTVRSRPVFHMPFAHRASILVLEGRCSERSRRWACVASR